MVLPPGQFAFLHRASEDMPPSLPIIFLGPEYYLAKKICTLGFPGGSVSTESACNVGDLGSVPGLGRSPGGGHGNPLQCSYLENPMDRGAWWVTVHPVAKNPTRLSD